MNTPIEKHDVYLIKRDDLYSFGNASGGKSRTMAQHHTGPGILTAGTKISPQIERAALVAKELGVRCRIHTGGGKPTPEIQTCIDAGAEVIQHAPGYLTQISKGLREDAAANPDWMLWPFGMGRQEYVDDIAAEAATLPWGTFKRIVVPVGSGMTLAGILHGIPEEWNCSAVLGVTVGADPIERLDKYAPDMWRRNVTLVPSGTPYDKPAKVTHLGDIPLDAHYEAKCIDFLQAGDLLWCVGLRNSQRYGPMPTAQPTPATNAPPAPAPGGIPAIHCAHKELMPIGDLRPNPKNPNRHPAEQIRLLAKIIASTGFRNPIVISDRSGFIVKGHGRLEAARLNGYTHVPVDVQHYETDAQEIADLMADNSIADLSSLNQTAVKSLLAELTASGHDTELAGFLKSHTDQATERKAAAGKLREKFLVSPFTVLDTRCAAFLERRQLWLQLGIESEIGRDGNLTFANSSQPPHVYSAKNKYEATLGRTVSWDEFLDNHPDLKGLQGGTSIFNPVLCEIFYNWFLPSTGSGEILDPFAGGSVRGVVAAFLGHAYTGIELRPEQVVANQANAAAIFASIGHTPKHAPQWITGSSADLETLLPEGKTFDLVFSCPPYGDLEVYSDNPEDLSAQPEHLFRENYTFIVQAATGRLKPNRFSIWVIGDYRDKKTGTLRNFVNTTINAHTFPLYNHAILLNSISSLAIRITRNFPAQRKLGKAHQDVTFLFNGDRLALEAAADASFENIVMFYQGQADKIPEHLGPLSAREITPLGDILAQLTSKP